MAGLLGVGGGAIIVPALANALLLLGYDSDLVQHVAVGTSLAIIIPTGIMSARAHQKRGALDLPTLKLWVPFIVVGTLIGGLAAAFMSGDALRIVFAVMAFVIAANIVFGFQTKIMGHLHGSEPDAPDFGIRRRLHLGADGDWRRLAQRADAGGVRGDHAPGGGHVSGDWGGDRGGRNRGLYHFRLGRQRGAAAEPGLYQFAGAGAGSGAGGDLRARSGRRWRTDWTRRR